MTQAEFNVLMAAYLASRSEGAARITQEEFDVLMDAYLAQRGEGYYMSKYSGEEIDALLDSISGGGRSLITAGTEDLADGADLANGTIYVKYS